MALSEGFGVFLEDFLRFFEAEVATAAGVESFFLPPLSFSFPRLFFPLRALLSLPPPRTKRKAE